MRQLVLSTGFKRAFRKFVKRNPQSQSQIEGILSQMQADVFAPPLGTHKLSGNLSGLRACSCGYDCRIVFSIEKDKETEREVIVLIDIGTHDEVY
ncbi:MAG: type II toxin-antitoxin system mRNA interferase toxin, RelE/StbE family [Cyanobacteria bacterium CRU_2_1]|nr:type II toxin-antitoxin system mRNA interferase toxin, RelE/StbE family [Cyanobacteria bacterium RU_5_0]NJR57889.1 type II toxin-antitoxin system mRNA interferase toxin, RelE/StbE family [Cyanobacteria bacterium CRU_2_1]